jgi:hypothetical protein
MYACVSMFLHNYLSVNGIVSFPSFTWLYKYKEEYKQGEMWHSTQSELLIARQRFCNLGYIYGNNWSWRLKKERL